MFELTYELLAVAASNPHLIFLLCNLIIIILIFVSLEPTSNSDDHKHTPTATPIPSSLPVTNETKSFETTPRITVLEETTTTTNVLIDVVDKVSYDCDLSVDKVSYDCELSVNKDCNISVDKVSYDCNLEDKEELEDDDELRRRVEEFIDKINSGWKAEKLSLRYHHQLNSSALLSYGSKSGSRPTR